MTDLAALDQAVTRTLQSPLMRNDALQFMQWVDLLNPIDRPYAFKHAEGNWPVLFSFIRDRYIKISDRRRLAREIWQSEIIENCNQP